MANRRQYWFKAKNYGWGWYPASYQGWIILLGYVFYLAYRAIAVNAMFDTFTSFIWRYLFEFALPTGILLVICYLTGEKPKWRWGDK